MQLSDYGLVSHVCATVEPGQRFGRITILMVGKIPDSYRYKAVYRCDCGTVRMTALGTIQIGTTLSCGCKSRDDSTVHGLYKSPLYRVWRHMIARCNDKNDRRYHDYGDRGITVCERWHDVRNFHSDMLSTYADGLTLERIDNSLGYSPENCRWATRHEQMRNRRNNIFVTIDGRTLVLKDWAAELGVSYHSVYHRVTKMGWPAEKALTTPFRSHR